MKDATPFAEWHFGHLEPAFCAGAGFAGFAIDGAGLLPGFAGFGFDLGSAISASFCDRVSTRNHKTTECAVFH